MITKDTLPQLLALLDFSSSGKTFRKGFGDAEIVVDFSEKSIAYPKEMKIHDATTCNFSANENFVVLECVCRLLEKGYKPEHIELEPKWKLGHGASGGRADILVKDNAVKALLLIECKTSGGEFNKAWNKTLQDGDQLFSYAQQISETQFLCLYASDYDDGVLTYTSHIIAHRDNEKYLADNPLFKSFRSVTDVKERYAVWRNTYKLDYKTKGIFEGNIQPYHIGKDKYSLDDLQAISAADQQKKYHEFATILRQHNVSGRENAFDKLVNLFLCKLVDETENPRDLKFYWKGVAYDTHFELLDRLQQLYQSGMGKFLGEDITYINQNDVNNALRFIRQNPDATQRAVWNLFIQQKFFTNNDFSLIDVHNEKLFYQNAEVLLKILQMWQDIRLTNPSGHNQFLGDMFEGFLDQGVKQSEGQYFTPMPICKFILMSLPLQSLVQNSATPPKAIDYACGAGHFLNELASQLKPLVAQHKQADMVEYHKAIFGIEKEYRLSKVAKVSAFMYGQQDINICYGDALVNQHTAFPGIKDGSFDLLVANPPYSVRGFLETLSEEQREAYSLIDTIDKLDTANSIETFFIERGKQLLKAGGVATLILPSSILSNGGNTYIRTREILLQYFDIVAIAEFGSGTFGKTGTNTVTLFMRRKQTAPDTAEHYRERVDEWFRGCANNKRKQVIYKDDHLIGQYSAHIGVVAVDYKTLLSGQPNDALLANETFAQYRKSFEASPEIVNLKQQRGFKAKLQAERETELAMRFLAFVQAIERDKLYHFVMASDQPNPVLIIRSPNDTKAQKQFLGYQWSSAKGNEGIQISKDANGHHITPLYDETDRNNTAKLNRYVADNFDGTLAAIPSSLSDYASTTRLVDMLDFSRVTFEKQIAITTKRVVSTQGKWPLIKLGDVTDIKSGGTPSTNNKEFWDGGEIFWATLVDTKQKYLTNTQRKITQAGLKHSTLLPINTVIFSSRATIGEVCINKVPTATNQGYKNFICDPTKISYEYLYYLLVSYRSIFENIVPSGAKYKEINTSTIRDFPIPLPPLDVQSQIVSECETIDAEVKNAHAEIQSTKQNINDLVRNTFGNHPRRRLDQIGDLSRGASPRPINEYLTEDADGVPWIKIGDIAPGEKYVRRTAQRIIQAGAEKSRYVRKGDFIISNSMSVGRPYILDIDGCVHDGWLIVANIKNEVDKDYLYYALSNEKAQAQFQEHALGGVVQNLNIDRAKSVTIAVPPLAEQKAVVAEIELLERVIAEAQAVVAAEPAKKHAIMQRYL